MSYELLNTLHLVFVLVFFSGITVQLFDSRARKGFKYMTVGAVFAILFAGLGMVYLAGGSFPLWLLVKALIWMVVSMIALMLAKGMTVRGVFRASVVYSLLILLLGLAIYFSFTKPS